MNAALLAAVAAVILPVGSVLMVRRLMRNASEEMDSVHPQHTRLLTAPMAGFFGLRSAGMKQLRGNGILLLTKDSLFFRMLLPRRELVIPLSGVTAVRTPGSFLGKTKGRKLLQVDFTGPDGTEDSAAWLVPDLDEWVGKVRGSAGPA